MKKLGWRVALIVVLLAVGILACKIDWNGVCVNSEASEACMMQAIDATATFGAEQLHVQLTEMAK
jgi:hypothetical protein